MNGQLIDHGDNTGEYRASTGAVWRLAYEPCRWDKETRYVKAYAPYEITMRMLDSAWVLSPGHGSLWGMNEEKLQGPGWVGGHESFIASQIEAAEECLALARTAALDPGADAKRLQRIERPA